ncbi:hypothetical protein [Tissierella sp.]|uniref:hypothetical protein n=1 Tax=Tissierella sp. TaxID=41274 RepID=UPI0030236223
MEKRKAVWYSIIRYSPNNVSGEIVNTGLLLHSVNDNCNLKYLLLDENSYKLRSIINNKIEADEYKSYKDVLEYYISKCNEELFGVVGDIAISSCDEINFLDKIYEYCIDNKLTLTKPSFAFTDNIDMLFKGLIKTYIGDQYMMNEPKTVTAKKQIKEIFEKRDLIGRKIKTDLEFNPIAGIDNLRVKVDFGFKNGVWNYIETIPALRNDSEISDWFAKTRFTIETLKLKDNTSKIHLAYKLSDFKDDITLMFDYLSANGQEISGLNVEETKSINELCDYIEMEAEDIDEYIAC